MENGNKMCSNLTNKELPKCGSVKQKTMGVVVKKGMAEKAFWEYARTGDIKNIQRQFDKGLAKRIF